MLGTPKEVTNSAGEIVWQADYKAWGEIDLYRVHQIDQPLRFQGQYADDETGLYYTTFRYYDPHSGRFTTQDPIGLAGGLNLYQYAPNPTGWVDPFGLTKCKITSGSDVTPEVVQDALEGDTMRTVQGTVSLPAVQRYVDRLLKGDVAPPIKVDGNVIVEGNHRYVAGKVVGILPEQVSGTLSPSNIPRVKPISETVVDLFDWGNH